MHRTQRESDGPRCQQLTEENNKIMEKVFGLQNARAEVSKEVDARKKDKSALSRQRVRSSASASVFIFGVVHHFSYTEATVAIMTTKTYIDLTRILTPILLLGKPKPRN